MALCLTLISGQVLSTSPKKQLKSFTLEKLRLGTTIHTGELKFEKIKKIKFMWTWVYMHAPRLCGSGGGGLYTLFCGRWSHPLPFFTRLGYFKDSSTMLMSSPLAFHYMPGFMPRPFVTS